MSINWSQYAEVYDLMTEVNPAYQELVTQFREAISSWPSSPGDTFADFGAGTGNFSIPLAKAFTTANVIHIDADANMNARAMNKATDLGIRNLEARTLDFDNIAFAEDSLAGIISVHALYTAPKPQQLLQRMHTWLRPGGHAFLCDLGRTLNIADWTNFLVSHMLRNLGPFKTLLYLIRGHRVASANRNIAKLQKDGVFWTHTHDDFVTAAQNAGFTIARHHMAYRGYSDVLICTKL